MLSTREDTLSILPSRLPRLLRIWLFCSMVSSCTGCAGRSSCRTESAKVQTGAKGANLQADLHQVDEPAQLFDDLVALLRKLGGRDDLPARYAAPTAWTTERNVRHLSQSPLLLVFANAVEKRRRFLRNELDHRLLLLQCSCQPRTLVARCMLGRVKCTAHLSARANR